MHARVHVYILFTSEQSCHVCNCTHVQIASRLLPNFKAHIWKGRSPLWVSSLCPVIIKENLLVQKQKC